MMEVIAACIFSLIPIFLYVKTHKKYMEVLSENIDLKEKIEVQEEQIQNLIGEKEVE